MNLRTALLTVLLVTVAVIATAFTTPTTQIGPTTPTFAWPQVSWMEMGTSPVLSTGSPTYDIPLVRGAFHGTDIDADNDNLIDNRLDLWITVYHGGSIVLLDGENNDNWNLNDRVQLVIWDSVADVEYPVVLGAVSAWPGSGFEVDAAGAIRIPSGANRYGLRLRYQGSGTGSAMSYMVVGVGRRDTL